MNKEEFWEKESEAPEAGFTFAYDDSGLTHWIELDYDMWQDLVHGGHVVIKVAEYPLILSFGKDMIRMFFDGWIKLYEDPNSEPYVIDMIEAHFNKLFPDEDFKTALNFYKEE